MSAIQHAWLGNYEVSSTTCTGLTFTRHSHDECVIGVNLVGEEKVWLDRREFEAGPGTITLYNPGQIQGGGAAEGAGLLAKAVGQSTSMFAGPTSSRASPLPHLIFAALSISFA
ncbi:hypothetical protein AZH11_13410 [Pseudomonas simiae]|nr:hypothetical protein AZH11_13410 [Pseudomonas simiae]